MKPPRTDKPGIENCECCWDEHYKRNLKSAPQARRTGVGHRLCKACRDFLDGADDAEFAWLVKYKYDDDRDRPVPEQ